MNINDINILHFSSGLEAFTPDRSGMFLEEFTYRLQRKLRPANIDGMDRAMRRGEFPLTMITLCESLDTRKMDLLDGFHRLTTSRDRGLQFRAIVSRCTVPTEADKESLWLFIDGGGSLRQARDYGQYLADEMAGLKGCERSALERAAAAIASGFSIRCLSKWRGSQAAVSCGEKIQVMEQYTEAARKYFSAIKGACPAVRSAMHGGFATSLACVLIDAQEEIAVPFFRSIATNDTNGAGDPRHLFFSAISTPNAMNRNTLETMRRLALNWNSHYSREKRWTYNRLDVPVPLKGTAFTIGGE
jgi:hypothetical protein